MNWETLSLKAIINELELLKKAVIIQLNIRRKRILIMLRGIIILVAKQTSTTQLFFQTTHCLFGPTSPTVYLFIILNIFLLTSTKIDDLYTNMPISKFQSLNMRKKCEKHIKKDPYIGSKVLLLQYSIFKVYILFFLVYICFLTSTINTTFFDFPFPRLIKNHR